MSKLQASRTIKFISKVGTFTAALRSNYGQLWQMYQLTDGSEPTETTVCTPDYNSMTTKPVLYFVVISSRTATGSAATTAPDWYFGGTKINNGTSILPAYSSYFDYVLNTESTDNPYYGLRIKKNLPYLTKGTSVDIKAVANVNGANYTDEVQASTTVNITPASSDKMFVNIIDYTNKNFTFTSESENITLEAHIYQGTEEKTDTTKLSYSWEKIVNGAWTPITSGGTAVTTKRCTINEDDVMTYCKVRCGVSYNNSSVVYGFAPLMDATDPYILLDGAVKYLSDGTTAVQDDITLENSGEYIKFTPKIVTRSNPEDAAFTGQTFNFTLMKSDGVDITPSSGFKAVATATVDYDLAYQNGDIEAIIETVSDFNDYN